jgi:RNA polymerase sigma-70 factor (ECF subfamily)
MVMHWNSRLLGPLALAAPPRPELGRSVEPAEAPASPAEPSPVPADLLLEGWFRDHFTRLWRLVARLGVPGAGIDDVVQETFITASRRQADVVEGRVWPFLVGTAVRLSANQRTRAATRREVVHTELLEQRASGLPDAEQLLADKRRREELERALGTLSEAHRAVFVLYELEGFSAPEIGELLGLPLGTVASRLGRARAKFSAMTARLERARLARPEDS